MKTYRKQSIAAMKVVLSLFVGLSFALSASISYTGIITDPFPDNFAAPFSFVNLAILIVCSAAMYLFLTLLQRAISKHHTPTDDVAPCGQVDAEEELSFLTHLKTHKLLPIASFFIIFLAWFLIFLNYYPGTSMNDQMWIIDNPLGNSNNHPILYNIALGGCVRIGTALFDNGNIGFALYIIAQMALCAAIVAALASWLSYRKAPIVVIAFVIAVFALTPIISNYSISAIKDTLFAYALLCWIPFLYESIRNPNAFWKKKSSYVALILLIAAISLVRNNGIYIAVAMALILVVSFRRQALLKICLASLVAIAVSLTPTIGISLLGHEQLFRESVGIPLQQISAVVCEDEESLTEEQRAFINEMIPIETAKSSYAPMTVDSIKYNPDFNSDFLQQHKTEFFKTYLQLGLSHPATYLRAFLSQTWGYWSVTAWDSTQSYFFQLSDNLKEPVHEQLMEKWGLHNNSLYPSTISQTIDSAYSKIVPIFPGPGLCLLLLLVGTFLLTVAAGSPKWAIIAGPFILLWLTLLISTPLSCSMRYAFPILISLPIIYAIFFAHMNFSHSKHGKHERP